MTNSQTQSKKTRFYARFWFQAVLVFIAVTIAYWVWHFAIVVPIENVTDAQLAYIKWCIDTNLDEADEFGGCAEFLDVFNTHQQEIVDKCLFRGETLSTMAILYDSTLFSCMQDEGLLPF